MKTVILLCYKAKGHESFGGLFEVVALDQEVCTNVVELLKVLVILKLDFIHDQLILCWHLGLRCR